MELAQLRLVEELDHVALTLVVIEPLEHAVHTRYVRPAARVLIGGGVRIVGLADVQEVEGRLLAERHLREHRRHVVVLRHQLVRVEVAVDRRVLVEDRHRNAGVSSVPEGVLQVGREEERRQQLLELHVVDAEPLAIAHEILLVVLRRVDLGRARVRQESHQQVVMGGSRPGRVAPAPFDRAELSQGFRLRRYPRVVAQAVENDEDEIPGH